MAQFNESIPVLVSSRLGGEDQILMLMDTQLRRRGGEHSGSQTVVTTTTETTQTLTAKLKSKSSSITQKSYSSYSCCGFRDSTLDEITREDNPFLLSGYRAMPSNSISASFKSMFELHNETLNIWTHAIACVVFIYWMWDNYWQMLTAGQPLMDRIVFLTYLFCVSTCFFISTFYHTFRNYSVNAYANWLISDINGVGLYVLGCDLLVCYFRFACNPALRWSYMGLAVTLYLSMAIAMPFIVHRKLFNLRTILFGILTLVGLVAHIHADILQGVDLPETRRRNDALFWVPICVIGSMIIRNAKFPERFFPRKFDIFFASHQWFHVLVFLGMCCLYTVYFREFGPGFTPSC